MQVVLPAVLGIQAAEKPPRYVPISKVRATMKTAKIETFPAAGTRNRRRADERALVPTGSQRTRDDDRRRRGRGGDAAGGDIQGTRSAVTED